MFQGSFKSVSRRFQGNFKGVSRKFKVFQVRLKGGSSNFKGGCRKKFKRSVMEVSMLFQMCFKGVSRKFQRSFKDVSGKF